MRLIERLKIEKNATESYFRQHLLQEDVGRLERLVEQAPRHSDRASFVAAGLELGWTPENRRTHELRPALVPLLESIHDTIAASPDMPGEQDIDDLWRAFEALRMDRLVGCLARVPRPLDVKAP